MRTYESPPSGDTRTSVAACIPSSLLNVISTCASVVHVVRARAHIHKVNSLSLSLS